MDIYILTGFSPAIFNIHINPNTSITVSTESAYIPDGNGYAHG